MSGISPNSVNPAPKFLIAFLICLLALTSACSTRQAHESFSGSTAQRLVTHSIQKLAEKINYSDIDFMQGQPVHVKSHFVLDNQNLKYAHEYFSMEFRRRFDMKIVDIEQATYIIDLFFTSLGTDQDNFGLTIPIVNLNDPSQSVNFDILAIDMYHGISEAKMFITNVAEDSIEARKKLLARVRTDKVSTPIFSFPISTLGND